jgi:hypothetical protein
MSDILDKNGVVIEEFDVLKVFHFIGARRKKHYMYKIVVLHDGLLYGSHIDSNPLKPGYPLWITSQDDTEVVQSSNYDKLYRRTRRPK